MMARITEVVSATEGLKTLSEALIVSGLDETLSEEGPYTLFAPNEAAFSEIEVDALVALAADCDELACTLRSHVVSGRHSLSDLVRLKRLESIEGTELFVSLGVDDEPYVEEARIVRGDIEAENGIIHLIDLVIMPLAGETVIVDEATGFVSGNVIEIVADSDSDSVFDYEAYGEIGADDDSVAV
jgi:uncharacterized surface protein with fasciclin (FAS1) repeats